MDAMYKYPIYKHLTQFSNCVDDQGKLKNIIPTDLMMENNGVLNNMEGMNPQVMGTSADKITSQSTIQKPGALDKNNEKV